VGDAFDFFDFGQRVHFFSRLQTDQHLVLDKRPLRDLYLTLMNDVYQLNVSDFGQDLTGAKAARISQLLSG